MRRLMFAAAVIAVFFAGCFDESAEEAKPLKKPVKSNPNGLTDFEMDHGVGPITAKLKLGPIDNTLAAKGKKTFENKCYQCHRLDSKLVGPPLKDVTKRRKPEYILNMMLNPDGMLAKHPEAKKLLGQYLTLMTFQNITKDDAMNILEYFRKAGQENKM